MAKPITTELGGVKILVETAQGAGSEFTSRSDGPVKDLFERAQTVIEHIAASAVKVRDQLSENARTPDEIDVRFGLKFSAKGDIIVAGASSDASLEVKITYKSPVPE